ncbi:MAG TPA: zf-HC2 domain-containing protein [Chloroflexota bacterium]|nr:zf-HC2 domain-containing protein [Chloroflexota bacterium]
MRCPDDALLDRWLDEALAADEAAAVAAHAASCPACARRREARRAEERAWRAALALDGAELAFLARADLAGSWRAAHTSARPASWWPTLVVLGLAGAYAAWLVALPALELLVVLANRLGLAGLALAWLLAQAWYLGAALLAALAAPPLIDPPLVAAGLAAALVLVLSRPWQPTLPRRAEIE